MRKLNVGVVGCGLNSENHLRVYSKTKGVRLVAVCDTTLAKAQERARKFGAQFALSDYDSMLRLDLDLVDVVTPTSTHAPLTIQALEAGHNVLVEKPMALSSKDASTMIAAARKSGRTLCVNHNKLFFRSVISAKKAVEEGSLTVSQMRISHHFAYKRVLQGWRLNDESGGIFWDALVHPVYLTEHFLGPATSVFAVARRIRENVFDSFVLVLQNQRMATVDYFWNAKYPLLELQVLSRDGDCILADLVHDLVVKRSGNYITPTGRYVMRMIAEDIDNPIGRWFG